MTIVYTAKATATGGREGTAETDDGKLNVNLTKPDGAGTNPEQLFAIGYAACFGGAVQFIGQQQKLDTGKVSVQSDISLDKSDSGFAIGATLNVTIPNLDADAAVKLVVDAHQFCPYSKATRNNINVKLTANGKAAN